MRTEASGRNGSLSAFFLPVLSVLPWALIFGRSWPFLALWVAGSGVRLWARDRKVSQDCTVFALLGMLSLRKELIEEVQRRWIDLNPLKDERSWLAALAFVAAALAFYVHRYSRDNLSTPLKEPPEGFREWTNEHPKPLIFPCRTTHARIFPKRHAFEYSYLLCGFPITPAAVAADGTNFNDGRDRFKGSWWLRIRADDYLQRGYGHLGFYGKLQAYLSEQGVEDTEWFYAYLITAPRFFGYSFNPVSFWYIYDNDHELKRMILEVNNTFGERRVYLLDGSLSPSSPKSPEPAKTRFADIWMKDFHVSPFNSRKGSYALKASNPFPTPGYAVPEVDNTITLKSSKDHAKIVARVHTVGKPLNPARLGVLGTLQFIGSWWWVGFVTFSRILREAFKLFFRQSLHVWFRPEVLSTSIGRAPASNEETLEEIFKDYLNYLVHKSTEVFAMKLKTAIPDRPEQFVITTRQPGRERESKQLELRILSPAFYSRFVHYAHTSEAFDRECLFTGEKNRTLWISHPELLPLLLPNQKTAQNDTEWTVERNFLDELRWTIMKNLRCSPAEPAYPATPKSATFDIDDIRSLPFSELDQFVRGPAGRTYAGEYRRLVTKIFLAQRFALGFVEVIDVFDLILRVVLCWAGSVNLMSGVGGVQTFMESLQPDVSPKVMTGLWWMSRVAVYLVSCHMYGYLKGYR